MSGLLTKAILDAESDDFPCGCAVCNYLRELGTVVDIPAAFDRLNINSVMPGGDDAESGNSDRRG